jgi:thioredoxin reductase
LVIATGLKYSPLLIGNRHVPNVFHNTDDVPKTAKHQPAVVIGKDTNMDIKFALAVAKKYKQVYFCTTSIALSEASKANIKKLEETANIAILPNTTLAKVTVKDNAVISVDLDSYSTITCSAVYAKTNAVPDVCFIPDNIISKNNGYLETKNNAESTKVPRCYAIGECAAKSTNKMTQFMVEDILKYFNGGR